DVTDDVNAARERLQNWFDDSMGRVSGWYKRRTQYIIVAIAALLTFTLDVDTIQIVQRLQRDATFRAALVKQAEDIVQANAQKGAAGIDASAALASLEAAQPPFGWTCGSFRERGMHACGAFSWTALLGLCLSVLALSLGAPFWFDALNKLVNLRQTGAPPA